MKTPSEYFSGLQVMFEFSSILTILFLKYDFSRCLTEGSPKTPEKSEKHRIYSPSSL